MELDLAFKFEEENMIIQQMTLKQFDSLRGRGEIALLLHSLYKKNAT